MGLIALELEVEMPEWPDAFCFEDEDPERWFPDTQHPDLIDPLRRECWVCPRRDDCLAYAIESRQDDGVWGGMDEKQRRKIRHGKTDAAEEWRRFHGREDHRRRKAAARQLRLDLERKHPEVGSAVLDTATKIIDVVAKQHDVTPEDLYGRAKERELTVARQKAMLLIRMNTNMSYADIGRMFDRDHTTVMSAVKRSADRWIR